MSNQAAKPLGEFVRLNQNVCLYTPKDVEPDMLIIFCAWMAAAPKHIAKYTSGHMKMFPSASILLVTNSFWDFFRSNAGHRERLGPAVDVVRAHCNKSLYTSPNILIHSFSNGGANQLAQLGAIFKEKERVVIPARAIVLDSAPGKGSYWRAYAAISLSFPKNFFFRLFGPPLLHWFMISLGTYYTLLGKEDLASVNRRKLNDMNLFEPAANRLYLYSEADEMVWYSDVEEHGDDAMSKGMKVTKVKFIKSPHAGHIMEDQDKYWNAIRDVWKNSSA